MKKGSGLDTVEDDTGPSRKDPVFLYCVVCARTRVSEHDVDFEDSSGQ